MAQPDFNPLNKQAGASKVKVRERLLPISGEKTVFEDLTDRRSMQEFIEKHGGPVLQAQDDAIEAIRVAKDDELQENDHLLAPRTLPNGNKLNKSVSPRPLQKQNIVEEQEIENVLLRRPGQNSPQNLSNVEEELPEEYLHLPPEMQQVLKKSRAQMRLRRAAEGGPPISEFEQQIETETNENNENKVITNAPSGVIPGSPNTPQLPPQISASQMRKKVEEEIRNGRNLEESLVETKPRFILKPIESNADHVRMELVSGFVFYKFDNIGIRKFNLTDIVKLHQARKEGNITAFYDAVGSTLTENIRDLTMPDMRHILYWHRFYSYTLTPLNFEWTSKYGNKNYYKIDDSTLKFTKPKITKEEYKNIWLPEGFVIPTVRDNEVFEANQLSEEENWLYDKAQYFVSLTPDSSDIQGKMDSMNELCSADISKIERLEIFKADTDHGVNELVDITDAKFDTKQWLAILRKQHEFVNREIDLSLQIGDVTRTLILEDQLNELDVSIQDIDGKLNRQEVVEPDIETVRLNLPTLNFFPGL